MNDFIQELTTSPDVIAVTETWLRDGEEVNHQIKGYKFFNHNREGRGGGVAIYVHDGLKGKPVNTGNEPEFSSVDIVTVGKNILNVTVVYLPPKMTGTKTIDKVLDSFQEKKSVRIVCGDLNVNLLDSTTLIKTFVEEFHRRALASPILPTRVTRTSDTCIDHVWAL